MAGARYHYLNAGGATEGPFWLTQMRELWQKGRINARTEICMEGTRRWEPAEYYPEIFEEEARLPVLAKLRRTKSDPGRVVVWGIVLLLGLAVWLMQRWAEG